MLLRLFFLFIILEFFLVLSAGIAPTSAASDKPPAAACTEAFRRYASTPERKIENLEDLLQAFSHGFIPDLSRTSHRNAFEIYRKLRFGNPNTGLNPGSLDEVAEVLRKYPELRKEPFRDYILEVRHRNYPVTPELSAFLESHVDSANQARSNLFHIEANSGYWKKILQYEDPDHLKQLESLSPINKDATPEQKAAYRERIRKLKEDDHQHWMAFLDRKLPPELRSQLLDNTQNPENRAEALYRVLQAEQKRLAAQGKDTRPIAHAIYELVQTIGYHDPILAKALKSKDGMERLTAYRKIVQERDRFARKLKFTDHVPHSTADQQELEQLEQKILANTSVEESPRTTLRIRHLSIVEAPFRSCLGGADCSSRAYLTRALDPNYHYFTLTDENGASQGHVTVVLGEGKLTGTPVRTAFVDKIQNVSPADLPQMLEGVRRSLLEKGYLLAIPDDLADHNGLSVEELIRSFVEKYLGKDRDRPMLEFIPHSHPYRFPNVHSRAGLRLPSHAVAPLTLPENLSLIPGEINRAWQLSPDSADFDLNRLIQASMNLRNSSKPEDKIRYISSMKAIREAKLQGYPRFETALNDWLKDPSESFQVRKQALLYHWLESRKPLPALLANFDKHDQMQLIQNLLDTPRYLELILTEPKSFPKLLVMVRTSEKIRRTLLPPFAGERLELLQPLVEKVLAAKDIPDDRALDLLLQMKAHLDFASLKDLLQLEALVSGTSIEQWLRDQLPVLYALSFTRDTSLGRALSHSLESSSGAVQKFMRKLISEANDPRLARFRILQAFQDISSLQETKPELRDFEQAALEWIQSGDVRPELKACFLLGHLGRRATAKKSGFLTFRNAIPADQVSAVLSAMASESHAGIFEKLARESGVLREFGENARLESFEFQRFDFLPGGTHFQVGSPPEEAGRWLGSEDLRWITLTRPFEIQATPVTQLQWALVMGNNPSGFKVGKLTLRLKEKEIDLDPNRPVEMITWEETQQFIRRLNELDPHFQYRLPTEAEWELAARSGSKTSYSFGNEPELLKNHGWYSANSGGQTREVAALKPNASGLYDMHGNVSEWVQDWFAAIRPNQLIDPTGPVSGTNRVIRGGGSLDDAKQLRSAQRRSLDPAVRSEYVGLRLVRTPR